MYSFFPDAAILLPDTNESSAERASEKIRKPDLQERWFSPSLCPFFLLFLSACFWFFLTVLSFRRAQQKLLFFEKMPQGTAHLMIGRSSAGNAGTWERTTLLPTFLLTEIPSLLWSCVPFFTIYNTKWRLAMDLPFWYTWRNWKFFFKDSVNCITQPPFTAAEKFLHHEQKATRNTLRP